MNARDGEAAPVELRGLDKTYRNGTRANCDISLSVRRGELLGILGPNCAGKTTLVRQITTELMPTSGEVQVFGINAVAHPNRVKGLMGVMPAGGQPLLSAVGAPSPANLRQAAGLPRREASGRAEELLSVLGLEEHGDKGADACYWASRRLPTRR